MKSTQLLLIKQHQQHKMLINRQYTLLWKHGGSWKMHPKIWKQPTIENKGHGGGKYYLTPNNFISVSYFQRALGLWFLSPYNNLDNNWYALSPSLIKGLDFNHEALTIGNWRHPVVHVSSHRIFWSGVKKQVKWLPVTVYGSDDVFFSLLYEVKRKALISPNAKLLYMHHAVDVTWARIYEERL